MGEAPMPRLHFRLHGHTFDFRNCRNPSQYLSDAVIAKSLKTHGLRGLFDLSRRRVLLNQLADIVVDHEQFTCAKAAAIARLPTRGTAPALDHSAGIFAAKPLLFGGVGLMR